MFEGTPWRRALIPLGGAFHGHLVSLPAFTTHRGQLSQGFMYLDPPHIWLCYASVPRRFEYKASNFAIRPRSNLDLPRLGCSWGTASKDGFPWQSPRYQLFVPLGSTFANAELQAAHCAIHRLVVLKSQHAEVKKETLRREIRRQRATRNHSVLAKCATGDPVVWRVQAFSRFCNAQ